MADKITESAIEKFAIEILEKQDYQYVYAPDIAPDASTSSATGVERRNSYDDVLLFERLRNAVGRINPTIPTRCAGRCHKTNPSA